MKRSLLSKLYIILMVAFAYHGNLIAQVGIGTTSPQETLHIAGTTRVDDLPFMPGSNKYVVADIDGKLGWNIGSVATGPNFQSNTLMPGSPADVIVNTNGIYFNNDINLNLNLSVTVPAGSIGILNLYYSVPCKLLTGDNRVGTYLGSRFKRNGIAITSMDRFITLPTPRINNVGDINGFGYTDNVYYGIIQNLFGNTPLTTTFTVVGIIEQIFATDNVNIYRFGGLSGTGRSVIKYQLTTYTP
jgi:hypothetical protein